MQESQMKSKAPNFILYGLYSILVLFYAYQLCFQVSNDIQTGSLCYILAGGMLLVSVGICFGLYKGLSYVQVKSGKGILATLFNSLLILGGIVFRFSMYAERGFHLGSYESLLFIDGNKTPSLIHGIEYLYLRVMREGFWLFGNRAFSGFAVSLCMEIVALIFISGATFRMFGLIGSVATVTLCSFSVYLVEGCLFVRTTALVFLFFSFFLWIMSYIGSSLWSLIPLICLGICTGAYVYLDVLGLACFSIGILFILFSLFVETVNEKAETIKKAVFIVLYCGLSVISYFGCLFLDSEFSRQSFGAVLAANINQYGPSSFRFLTIGSHSIAFPEQYVIGCILMIGIFCFFAQKTRKQGSSFIVGFTFLFVASSAFEMSRDFSFFDSFFILAICISGAVIEMLLGEKCSPVLVEAKEPTVGTPGKVVTVDIDGEKKQVKLLDNPLKVPEKKEHKSLDYDVEVSDDDNYDI